MWAIFLAAVIAGPSTIQAKDEGAVAAPSGMAPRSGMARLDSLVAAESRVAWVRTPADSALTQAVREGKPAFLDFYAEWCGPCKWMDRAVYNDPLLAEASADVVMLRIDIDRPEGRSLANRYGVFAYPTLVYLGRDGGEKLRWVGALNLRDTRLNLAQATARSDRRSEVEASRRARPDDPAAQAEAMRYYGLRGEVERVRDLASDLRARFSERPGVDRARIELTLALAEEIADHPDRALAAYRQAQAADPDGALAWRAWIGASVCLERLGRREEALEAARQAAAHRSDQDVALAARVVRLSDPQVPLSVPQGVANDPPHPPGSGSAEARPAAQGAGVR